MQELALTQGLADTRLALVRWRAEGFSILRGWLLVAAAIAVMLLGAVVAVGATTKPDLGFEFVPPVPHGPALDQIAGTIGRNSLVLALHAMACVAGFIAGSSLPLSAERRGGISRLIHERARPLAFAWVAAVTIFSLITQAYALGLIGSTLAYSADLSVPILVMTALPHALVELTAVFLPLAAWTLASRRREWDQLLAATLFTVGVAVPMLLAAAIWEIHVWPHLVRAASPLI